MPCLTTKRYIEVPRASLDNNKGDVDRVSAVLQRSAGDGIEWPLGLMRGLPAILREADGLITVTLWPDGDRHRVVAVEPGDTTVAHWGVAVDLGTTVVAVELIDLASGVSVASSSDLNGQVPYGEDLLTRLHFAAQRGLSTLHHALLETVNSLIAAACATAGVDPLQVSAVCAAGNTSMTHLFLGLDPSSIRQEPYAPLVNHVPMMSATEVGLRVAPHAVTYLFPSVGGYFGGDLIAGVIAAGIGEHDGLSLLVDIGTNVEIVLGNREWLVAEAGSAGPALEGGVAECAMRAAPGAIDRVSIDPDTLEPSYSVLDDAPAIGLCGSGLIDVVAQLYEAGLLDATGRFVLDKKTDRWQQVNGKAAYVLAPPHDDAPGVYITEQDVQNLLETKAAMVAALTVLLESVGVSLEDIERIYTAGSFGIYIDVASATAIGLYPRVPHERFVTLGNGSLKGAREVLLDAAKVDEARRLADKITYLELNIHAGFWETYRSAKYLP